MAGSPCKKICRTGKLYHELYDQRLCARGLNEAVWRMSLSRITEISGRYDCLAIIKSFGNKVLSSRFATIMITWFMFIIIVRATTVLVCYNSHLHSNFLFNFSDNNSTRKLRIAHNLHGLTSHGCQMSEIHAACSSFLPKLPNSKISSTVRRTL